MEQIILLNPSSSFKNLPDLIRFGLELKKQGDPSFEKACERVNPEELQIIVYTSGTTGEPRGVMLSHANILSNVIKLDEIIPIQPGETCLSLLPCWHMFERTVDYYSLAKGVSVLFTDKRRFKRDLAAASPSLMASVPRVWENLYDAIHDHLSRQKGWRGGLGRRLAAVAPGIATGEAKGTDRLLWRLLGKKLCRQVTRALGGKMRFAVSGGGMLPAHVDAFFVGAGAPLYNGYGLTETSPVVACRRPGRNRPGGVGPPLSETEVEIRDPFGTPLPSGSQGTIFVKGPQIMKGYYKNSAATGRVLSRTGWLDTGDLGRMDEAGHLYITGRTKETIVLASGENVEPHPLETVLTSSPLIQYALLVGQDQRLIGALLVPAYEELAKNIPQSEWETQEETLAHPKVLALFKAELQRLCREEMGFRSFERVVHFRLLSRPFTVENGLLTQTMKHRRKVILEKYDSLVAEMYGSRKAAAPLG